MLLLNPDSAHSLGKKGRRGIGEHFDVEKNAMELIGLLEKVIGET